MDYLAVCRFDSPLAAVTAVPLSPRERASLAICRSAKRRREVDLTRRLTRYGLWAYLDVPGDALQWDETGPRYTDVRYRVGLSASHSEHHAAVAWSAAGKIGVDIESLESPRSWRRIMNAMFCDRDADWITRGVGCNETVGLQRFLAVWTAREAYAKYKGSSVLGQLSRPLLREVGDGMDEKWVRASDAAWVEVRIDATWVAAVCRPLRPSMPDCVIGGPGSLRGVIPYRADCVFIAGAYH